MEYIKLGELCTKIGSGATPRGGANAYKSEGISLIRSQNVLDYDFSKDGLAFIDDEQAKKLDNVIIMRNDILLNITGDSVARCCKVPDEILPARVNQHVCIIRTNSETIQNFVFYYIQLIKPQLLQMASSGATRNALTKDMILNLEIPCISEDNMKKITDILECISDKIKLNNKLNANLEQLTHVIFDEQFPDLFSGNQTIGDYIMPKRGKNLLSKNAIPGVVPVIAGGLSPATYHNTSNTHAPVITISASGANAGFVNIWHCPVWSSDSSFIDIQMTSNVYFWYVMLKKRQKEIFDSQTGSAQPHIYPQHIAVMPLSDLDEDKVNCFTELVSPLFELIGNNLEENKHLEQVRDTLLPKLMSGGLN